MNFEKWLELYTEDPHTTAEARRRAQLEGYRLAHSFDPVADAATLERIRAEIMKATEPDSGAKEKRVSNEKGGVKADGDKPEMDLLPPAFLEQTAAVLTYGAHKYAANNWMKVERRRYVAALMRHLCRELRDPKGKDPETGLPHTAHIAANIAIIIGLDDIEERKKTK
ncbi:MAG: DUF5664 domain-containing protein [Methanoregula sp.]|nr:DUF5664 domain-containing protein [Methanoregula sp.]